MEKPAEFEIETGNRVEVELEENPEVLLVFDHERNLAWLEKSEDDELDPTLVYDNGAWDLEAGSEFGVTLTEERVLKLLEETRPI